MPGSCQFVDHHSGVYFFLFLFVCFVFCLVLSSFSLIPLSCFFASSLNSLNSSMTSMIFSILCLGVHVVNSHWQHFYKTGGFRMGDTDLIFSLVRILP